MQSSDGAIIIHINDFLATAEQLRQNETENNSNAAGRDDDNTGHFVGEDAKPFLLFGFLGCFHNFLLTSLGLGEFGSFHLALLAFLHVHAVLTVLIAFAFPLLHLFGSALVTLLALLEISGVLAIAGPGLVLTALGAFLLLSFASIVLGAFARPLRFLGLGIALFALLAFHLMGAAFAGPALLIIFRLAGEVVPQLLHTIVRKSGTSGSR